MGYKTESNGQMFIVFDEFLTEEEKANPTDYVAPNGCTPNIARAAIGLQPIGKFPAEDDDTEIIPNEIGFEMMKNVLPDEIIRWEKLRYWLEQQMSERRWAGDVYRYTAYEATFKKMEELNNE